MCIRDRLNTLKKQGKILHIGVSNFTKEQMEEAEKYCAIEAYQPQYSMVDRKWEQLIRWACAQEMGVMTYGTPVSYTHLDVYKRQVYRLSLMKEAIGDGD